MSYSFEETYENVSLLPVGEYEACEFYNCNFMKADLSKIQFVDCRFHTSDLSMAKLDRASLQQVEFEACKLLGVHFEDCKDFLFSVSFENCQLNMATFIGMKLQNMSFMNCNLTEADFSRADLTKARFKDCNLDKAIFMNTNLSGADFREAYNFTIYVERNTMKKAKFSKENLAGLLTQYQLVIS